MMNMMKKSPALLALSAIALTALVGCPATPAAKTPTTTPPAAATGGTTAGGTTAGGTTTGGTTAGGTTTGGTTAGGTTTTGGTTAGGTTTTGGTTAGGTTTGGTGAAVGTARGIGDTTETTTTRPVVACPTVDVTFPQVERLARPAVNEGLIRENGLLNTYNEVGPEVDLTSAASSVRTEAVAVLTAFGNNATDTTAVSLAKNGGAILGSGGINLIVENFLPDMMRIDMTVNTTGVRTANTVNGSYDPGGVAISPRGKLIGGRKPGEDVIDATLLYLVEKSVRDTATGAGRDLGSDSVSYDTAGGRLSGRTALNAVAMTSFPYLAAPF